MRMVAVLLVGVMTALGLATGVIFGAGIYSTKMNDFRVQEPLDIAGVLTQLECPAGACVYSPGQKIAEGRYEVKNQSGFDYGLLPSVQVDYPGYEPPTFIVLGKVGDHVFKQQTIVIPAGSAITILVEVYTLPNSPAGNAVNPRLQWERTYQPGCSLQGCG